MNVIERNGDLRILSPFALRLYVVAFLLLWCGLEGWYAVQGGGSFSSVVALIPFAAVGVGLAIRSYLVSILLQPEQMVVRNLFTTDVIRRDQVVGFAVQTQRFPPILDAVFVELGDGTVRKLQALSWYSLLVRDPQERERVANALQSWASGSGDRTQHAARTPLRPGGDHGGKSKRRPR